MQEMLVSQFVTGLRSVNLRMTMLRVQYNSLAELREATVEHEAVEAICTGQPARLSEKSQSGTQKQQGKSNAAEAQTQNQSEQSEQSGQSNARGRSKNQRRRANQKAKQQQSNQSNQGGSNGQAKQQGSSGGATQGRPKCSHCGKLGHTADKCYSRDRSTGPRSSTPGGGDRRCYRCNRMFHKAAHCYADRHLDGHQLPPNGVAKPDPPAASNATPASNTTTSAVSLGVSDGSSNLNCRGGASLTPAVRPSNNAWY